MKRVLFLLYVVLVSITITADLRVYSTKGTVEIKRNGTWERVKPTQVLFETDSLRTEGNGCIVFFDRTNNIPYSIQSIQTRLIKDVLRENKPHTTSLPSEFIKGAYDILLGYEKQPIVGEPGASSKGIDPDIAVASALKNERSTSYLVMLRLLESSTLRPVSQVYENQSIIAQISNNSNIPLYVNILDKDSKGELSALFPYSYDTIFHLYIPAYSTITLSEYRFSLFPANTTDQLTLVAYPLPFNLSNVLEIMSDDKALKKSNNVNEPIGIYQMSVPIVSADSY